MNEYMFYLNIECNLIYGGNTKKEAFKSLQASIKDRLPELSFADVTDIAKIDSNGIEYLDHCDNCGGTTDTWRNSSGELQCDNCGYTETE